MILGLMAGLKGVHNAGWQAAMRAPPAISGARSLVSLLPSPAGEGDSLARAQVASETLRKIL